MVYSGHIKNGVMVFDQPVVLPEGMEVSVEVPATAQPNLQGKGCRQPNLC